MKYTWTDHVITCRGCLRRTRIAAEVIAEIRESDDVADKTDAEVAACIGDCMACVDGEDDDNKGEHENVPLPDGLKYFDVGVVVQVEAHNRSDAEAMVQSGTSLLTDADGVVRVTVETQGDQQPGLMSETATKLGAWVIDAAFACGEWTSDDDDDYEKLHAESQKAQAAFREYIVKLESAVRIPNLTVRDVFAIAAGMEVACDDEEEPYPGLFDALEKVRAARQTLLDAGTEAPKPETSAQSQAFIDGASPWVYDADGADDADDDDLADDEGVLGALNSQYDREQEAPSLLADATGCAE